MKAGCLSRGLPFLVWLLALAGLVVWVLGTPGVQGTRFADGWTIGFVALICYLAAWPALLLARFGRRLWGGGSTLLDRLELIAMGGFLIAMLVAVTVMAN